MGILPHTPGKNGLCAAHRQFQINLHNVGTFNQGLVVHCGLVSYTNMLLFPMYSPLQYPHAVHKGPACGPCISSVVSHQATPTPVWVSVSRNALPFISAFCIYRLFEVKAAALWWQVQQWTAHCHAHTFMDRCCKEGFGIRRLVTAFTQPYKALEAVEQKRPATCTLFQNEMR